MTLRKSGLNKLKKAKSKAKTAKKPVEDVRQADNGLSLPLKYRPASFKELVGNEESIAALESIFNRKKGYPHAFLLQGPSGCGKTTIARIIKSRLDVSDVNYRELNASNTRGIDTIREVASKCNLRGLRQGFKLYLFDEAHQLTKDAQNAMLKMLEDAPPHVFFILATTDPEKIIRTIHTRCTTIKVSPLSPTKMRKLIKRTLEAEGVSEYPTSIIKKIADLSDGLPREALKMLDTVIDMEDEDQILEALTSTRVDEAQTIDLCRALISKQPWKKVSSILRGITAEPEQVRYAILGYLNSVALNKGGDDVIEMMALFLPSFMYTGKAGLTHACYCACTGGVPQGMMIVR